MKKIIFLSVFVFSVIASKSQSDLTLVIHDEVKKGYFKQESYDWVIQGLSDNSEANTFITAIKKDNNIKSATISPIGLSGEYKFKLSVNKIYGKQYFVKLLKRNGVTHALVNGKTEDLNEHAKGTD